MLSITKMIVIQMFRCACLNLSDVDCYTPIASTDGVKDAGPASNIMLSAHCVTMIAIKFKMDMQ